MSVWEGKIWGSRKKFGRLFFHFARLIKSIFRAELRLGEWWGDVGGGGSGKFSNVSKSFETINISSIFHFYLAYFILLILFLHLLAQHTSINFITTFSFNYTPLKLALNGIFQIKHQRYLY
jgi:hypothetical protein